MIVVYKYPLAPRFMSAVQMPAGARLLHAGMQYGVPKELMFVWALVNTNKADRTRRIQVVATGDMIFNAETQSLPHVGTVQTLAGEVFHVFDHGEL